MTPQLVQATSGTCLFKSRFLQSARDSFVMVSRFRSEEKRAVLQVVLPEEFSYLPFPVTIDI